jgi:hypothetical protein
MSTVEEQDAQVEQEAAEQPDVELGVDDNEVERDEEAFAAEPEPERREPASDMAMEKAFKKVESAAKGYITTINRSFEDIAIALEPCPLCFTRIPGFVDMEYAGAVPQELKDATMAYMGFAREQDYQPDPGITTCRSCGGLGKTATGSKVPGNETTTCRVCLGYGYEPPPSSSPTNLISAPATHHPAGEAPVPVATGDVDISGEPRILPDGRQNPNFEKWPQYKIPVEPYGVTANLTAQDAPVAA